jgi:hypothetical protein
MVQEGSGTSDTKVFPEGCVPATPCPRDHHVPGADGGRVADDMMLSCTPKILRCTGPSWETPDNNVVLLPWEPDFVANVVYKAGPFTSFHMPQSEATGRAHSYAVRAEQALLTRRDEDQETVIVFDGSTYTRLPALITKRDEDQKTIVVFGELITTLNPRPTPVVDKRDEDQESVYVYGQTTITVAPRPSKQEHFVIEATYVTNDKNSLVIPTVAPEYRRAGKVAQVVQEAAQQNIVIPEDTPLPSINPNAGAFNPTALDHPTTLEQVHRQLVSNVAPDADSHVEAAPDTTVIWGAD